MEQSTHRYRVEFSKGEVLRFIGHLDLHRTWERALRRAHLPLAYTQGMRPRIRLSIAQALPLGCSSEGELMDLWLTEASDIPALREHIAQVLPEGLSIENIQSVEYSDPKLQKLVRSAKYLASVPEGLDMDLLEQRVKKLLESTSLVRDRRGKSYDLRPLIISLDLDSEAEQLSMQLSSLDGATGRADEVLREIGIDPAQSRIHRTSIMLRN
jgi:radical SAM-linked protein